MDDDFDFSKASLSALARLAYSASSFLNYAAVLASRQRGLTMSAEEASLMIIPINCALELRSIIEKLSRDVWPKHCLVDEATDCAASNEQFIKLVEFIYFLKNLLQLLYLFFV